MSLIADFADVDPRLAVARLPPGDHLDALLPSPAPMARAQNVMLPRTRDIPVGRGRASPAIVGLNGPDAFWEFDNSVASVPNRSSCGLENTS